jgi:hypothetical protein
VVIVATLPEQQVQKRGIRSWSRTRWFVLIGLAIAVAVVVVLIVTYTGGGGSGGGGGGY